MRLTCVSLVVLLLSSCHQQPQRQPKTSDAALQRLHREMPSMTAECLDKMKWGGIEALPSKSDECFKFSAPEHMHGLWRNQFEASDYCESSARQCTGPNAANDPASLVWLELKPPAGYDDTPPGGLYAIDFIGRRSIGAGSFGHFGMSKNEVLVDRLLSIKLIEPPPSGQMTKAHIEGYRKDCAGKPICMPNSEVPPQK